MFQILPLIAASAFAVPIVPVEVWVLILRKLDPRSLLAACRANLYWRNICKGDPVLRTQVRQEVTLERQRRRLLLLNPGLLHVVTRENGPPRLFGQNVAKTVRRADARTLSQIVPDRTAIEYYPKRNNPAKGPRRTDIGQKNAGGKMKAKREATTAPYRTIRC